MLLQDRIMPIWERIGDACHLNRKGWRSYL